MLALLTSVYCVYDSHGKHFYKLKQAADASDQHHFKHKLVLHYYY